MRIWRKLSRKILLSIAPKPAMCMPMTYVLKMLPFDSFVDVSIFNLGPKIAIMLILVPTPTVWLKFEGGLFNFVCGFSYIDPILKVNE